MTLTLNISDDLRPEEASELVEIARETERPIGRVLLEAARQLVAERKATRLTKRELETAA